MASIFNALNIGYSGLNAAQIGIDVTGHNLANAETEGYTRQRVVNAAAIPVSLTPGDRGNGVTVTEIARVFDAFVYDRYMDTAQNKAYSDFNTQLMETLSTYFPDIEGVGVKFDMQEYFNLWQTFADNPDNISVKTALAQQTQTMSQHIQQTREQVRSLQEQVDEQLETAINEVNRIGREIADLNASIAETEAGGIDNANDLRDQRNLLELSLSKLIGADVFGGGIVSKTHVGPHATTTQDNYNVLIGGFNFIDGATFHPIGISSDSNPEGFNELYYERQDGVRIPFESAVKSGKVGAILDLRGSDLDEVTGIPQNGTLQNVLNRLDAFAAGLIESTNNLYARSATVSTQSNVTGLDPHVSLIDDSSVNINEGSFDIVVYDIDGNEAARRTINITPITVMDDSDTTPPDGTVNSIIGQIRAAVDDNADNNITNDINSLVNASYSASGVLSIDVQSPADGYTFAIEDNLNGGFSSGTNFAGAIGLQRFFDGDDAHDIGLRSEFQRDPSLISAHGVNVSGNNEVALSMVQLQFEEVSATVGGVTTTDTLYGFYDSVATYVGSTTNAAITGNETITAQFNAVEQEYFSISKVSIDEELTNLIKYQTAYGAAAKVITTIDQMMNTLLGIKQ